MINNISNACRILLHNAGSLGPVATTQFRAYCLIRHDLYMRKMHFQTNPIKSHNTLTGKNQFIWKTELKGPQFWSYVSAMTTSLHNLLVKLSFLMRN